jgi:hypothetical protein
LLNKLVPRPSLWTPTTFYKFFSLVFLWFSTLFSYIFVL